MGASTLRLLVGLGNPGPEYERTRHNAGFWFLDALARVHGAQFRAEKRWQGDLARARVGDRELELFKPMTWMNRSGQAIRAVADFYKIAPADILVAHDEIDLAVGTVRLKFGGGAGGHNGLRDTIAHIGDEFWRLRLGVGHPRDKTQEAGPMHEEVIDHVLRRAPREEEEAILRCVAEAVELMPRVIEQGPQKAMNRLHRKQADASGKAEPESAGDEARGKKADEPKQD